MADPGTEDRQDEEAGAEELPRLQRYDKRIKGWLNSLKDDAEQHAPEALDSLAVTAKNFAQYLENKAEQVRSKYEKAESESTPQLTERHGDSPTTEAGEPPTKE